MIKNQIRILSIFCMFLWSHWAFAAHQEIPTQITVYHGNWIARAVVSSAKEPAWFTDASCLRF